MIKLNLVLEQASDITAGMSQKKLLIGDLQNVNWKVKLVCMVPFRSPIKYGPIISKAHAFLDIVTV